MLLGLDPREARDRDTELLRAMLDSAAESAEREIENPGVRAEMRAIIDLSTKNNIAVGMRFGVYEPQRGGVRHYNTLEEEVIVGHLDDFMVPLEWTDDDIASVVAFLEALSACAVFRLPDPYLPLHIKV